MRALLAIKCEFARFKADLKGITVLEYALLAGIMVAALAIGFPVLTGHLPTLFNNIGANLVMN